METSAFTTRTASMIASHLFSTCNSGGSQTIACDLHVRPKYASALWKALSLCVLQSTTTRENAWPSRLAHHCQTPLVAADTALGGNARLACFDCRLVNPSGKATEGQGDPSYTKAVFSSILRLTCDIARQCAP